MGEPVQHQDVTAALVGIVEDLPGIEKKKHAGGVTYAYRGIEEITVALQPLLVKHGVIITPSMELLSVVDLPDKGNANNWTRTTVRATYTISLAGSESVIVASTIGVGDDNADKGANKAATQAFKYLLLQTFCIADPSEDGDSIPNDGLPPDGVRPRPGVPTTENPAQEEVPPVPEGWTNHEVCMAAHDALNERVKKLSTEQKAECSKLRQDAGGGWPLSLAGYESLAHFTTACEAFGDGAVPAAGAEVAATPDGF